MAARLQQEAEGYKTRVVETATGDAERFSQILAQYEKAPQVTRDRMYVDMMQQVLQSTTKVYVDTKDGNNLLYLPFDKLMEQNKTQVTVAAQDEATSSTATPVAVDASQTEASANVYNQRSLRDRSR